MGNGVSGARENSQHTGGAAAARKRLERLGLAVVLGGIVLALVLGRLFWMTQHDTRQMLVLFFESSVNGLAKTSPVKIYGATVGQVESVELRPPATGDDSYRVAVVISLDSKKLARGGRLIKLTDPEVLAQEIQYGLRGRLAMLSPASGGLYVELTRAPDVPVRLASPPGETLPEIPVIPSDGRLETYTDKLVAFSERDFAALERKWTRRLDAALAATAPEQVRAYNDKTLERLRTARALLNAPQLREDCRKLNSDLKRVRYLLGSDGQALVDKAGGSAAELAEFRKTLERVRTQLSEVAALLSDGAPALQELREQLREVSDAAAQMRNWADQHNGR